MKIINPLANAPVLLVAGCSSLPTGPNVLVLPGMGKSFEQFRSDDVQCRQYAYGNRVPVSEAFTDETPDSGQYPGATYPSPEMQVPALPPG